MPNGDPLPEEITLSAAEARVVYLWPFSSPLTNSPTARRGGGAPTPSGSSWRNTSQICPISERSNMADMSEQLLTLPEVAWQLHITVDEALRLVESRELPAGRGGDGGVYVRLGDLDSYLAAHASA
jgi:hypothetical protein